MGELRGDDVDRIIEQWMRVRPDADVTPLDVLSRMTRISRQLGRIRAEAFQLAGLEPWQWDVLAALRRADGPLSPKDLIAQTMVTSGTMTNRIDNLVASGLVERVEGGSSDRRVRLVTLTDEGIDRVDVALDALLEAERRLLRGIPADDQARLAELLRVLSDAMV
ncbi:MarR family winged helix-turn-helix transcriptional regulator [Agrococcus sp. HG114]|uniref:MarR family winged helix-turn-helix transcriptional regulator n=1 Tax=Agrococcus sp. HG114 TaxID=2969757 RepID=UPI00215B4A3C|nr:MarR family transcriptional regulator [Agrococcus sp. HG114]MCR8669805.1 MarR family transcriptional regulator [Agrococcus sp. HG114]